MKRINSKPIRLSTKSKIRLIWEGAKPVLIFLLFFMLPINVIFTVAAFYTFGEAFFDSSLLRFVLFVSAFVVAYALEEVVRQIIAVNKREKKMIDIWVELNDKKGK